MDILTIFSIFLLSFIQCSQCYEESAYLLPVQHCFSQDVADQCHFVSRGSLSIRSLKDNIASFTGYELNEDERFDLKETSKIGGYYRVRIPSTQLGSDLSSTSTKYVYSFMKACLLYESQLSDIITLHSDQGGNVFSVSLTAEQSQCAGKLVSDLDLQYFNSTVLVTTTVAGPVPDTQTFLEMKEREEKAKSQNPDNRSFFAKYWMYVIPGVLMLVMLSSAQDPQGGDGGGGR